MSTTCLHTLEICAGHLTWHKPMAQILCRATDAFALLEIVASSS